MSSTNKTDNYQLSQFVGSDIPSILNDYNGDMRKIDTAIHNASVAGGDNATAIAELQTTTNRMSTEMGGINSTVNTLSGKVLGIEEVIPATASEQNKLLTAQELPEIPSITELENDVASIEAKIPDNASASNKLVTAEDIEGGGHKLLATFASGDYSTINEQLAAIRTFLNTLDVAVRCRILLYDSATMEFLRCATKSGERFEYYTCAISSATSQHIDLGGARYEMQTNGGQIFDYGYNSGEDRYTMTIRNNASPVTVELYI